jgi:hypothetical protein
VRCWCQCLSGAPALPLACIFYLPGGEISYHNYWMYAWNLKRRRGRPPGKYGRYLPYRYLHDGFFHFPNNPLKSFGQICCLQFY